MLCPERIPFDPWVLVFSVLALCCFCSCIFICKKLDEDDEEEVVVEEHVEGVEIEVSE
jgi:hypothetical protein